MMLFLKDYLARHSSHLLIGQAARVGEYGQGITGQRCVGEDINLDEFVSASGHILKE